MKEITAIIRMDKMNATKRALADAGIVSMTARKVMGRGQGKVDYLLLQGAQEGFDEAIAQLGPGPKLIPKRMLLIVVNDHNLQKTIDIIINCNSTGSPRGRRQDLRQPGQRCGPGQQRRTRLPGDPRIR